MPLVTQILRNDEPLKPPGGWSEFACAAMVLAAAFDSGEGPFEGKQEPEFEWAEGWEWAGKTGADYPNVPCPISAYNSFMLTTYPIIATTPLGREGYTLKNKQSFYDVMLGQRFDLEPGDKLIAYRAHK